MTLQDDRTRPVRFATGPGDAPLDGNAVGLLAQEARRDKALARCLAADDREGSAALDRERHAIKKRAPGAAGDGRQALDGERLLASAPVVVLAVAAEIKRFAQSAELPLKRIRGQITRLAQTAESQALTTVVCAEGYVAPGRLGEHTLGASFDFHNEDLSTTPAGHQSNLDLLEEISPDLKQRLGNEQLDPQTLQGWAAFRCTSPDYLPIVGPLSDPEQFASAYAVLRKDARQTPDTPCPWLSGLYVNSGHGSRGLITAPLSGEILAAWINNEAQPVPRAVAEACHPNRFVLRALIRGQ